ncbi:MAG: flavin-containing monooxygenase [Albimonas sp.]|uniref:flavin-containing monooxygenase n=1 Tax=Albimonas sp. TaxID=1872425 RepID=UPI004055A90A
MSDPQSQPAERHDVVVVGAGFAGLYLLHRLRGMGLSVRVYERAEGVGDTWWWNRYPGARCDVESLQYSYSWDPELERDWTWSEKYAAQPEIQAYAEFVAERHDLKRDIRFRTSVEGAQWDEAAGLWRIATSAGPAEARHLVLATGCLSSTSLPDIPGRDAFRGETYHTGLWPHEGVDFTGKKVAVIGTGSSAIQAIPIIAAQARELAVHQRTPNFSIPARNAPLTDAQRAEWAERSAERREWARANTRNAIVTTLPEKPVLEATPEEREAEFRRRWESGGITFSAAFNDLALDPEANAYAAEFVRERIREIVRDPATAEALCPTDYPIFTKRICVDTDYFETFNLPHVRLVNLRETPLETVTEAGIRTSAGEEAYDAIVYATGFDAMTGAILAIDPVGRGGRRMSEAWAEGPKAYLGLLSAGFPNLFLVTGPGSPSVLTNMIVSIEHHVEMICEQLSRLAARGATRIEADPQAQEDWVAHVNARAAATLYPRAASWYMGANIPGKPRVFMPYIGQDEYRRQVAALAERDWPGLTLSSGRAASDAAAG